nr:TGF-beta receptor type-1 [Hymenolepis microstoma]
MTLLAIIIIFNILLIFYFKRRSLAKRRFASPQPSVYFHEISDSGSGAGKPFLVNRTIARQISLLDCIGKGRFGEVWRAACNEEIVAVKIFSSRDGASWSRETLIYTTALLCHSNILAYYASDMISSGGCTQLWLVTAYHEAGSLHDFLRSSDTIPPLIGLQIARSIAAGLAFLHSEIVGFHGKPSIAHRDIKSKNILMMANQEACLADFGLALVKDDGITDRESPPPASPFAGTKRYMAPEVLSLYPLLWGGWRQEKNRLKDDGEENLSVPDEFAECRHPMLSFEVYQSADVYAMGLVLWEIWRRCSGLQYELPYYDAVPADPTFLQMYRVVVMGEAAEETENNSIRLPVIDLSVPIQTCHLCSNHLLRRRISNQYQPLQHYYTGGRRPSLSMQGGWLGRLEDLIVECWHPVCTHRLSALRLRKSLTVLEAKVKNS